MAKFVVFCAITWIGMGNTLTIPTSDSFETLAQSKILMDKTSAEFSQEKTKVDPVALETSAKSLYGIAAGSIIVAQCRASCFTKFALPSTTTVAPNKIEEATTIIMDALSKEDQIETDYQSLMPKILRSRRSVDNDFHGIQTAEVAQCWKACQPEESRIPKMAVEPVKVVPQENVVEILSEKLTWPKYTIENGPVVYIVIQEYADRKWREIAQTTQLELPIPVDLSPAAKQKLSAVRVLSVTPEGLKRIYGVKPTATVETSQTNSVTSAIGPLPLRLRVDSLIHQNSLVLAEISWTVGESHLGQEYQVTWEIAGGGLKGHLVTESTSVTLSLWPKTSYQISVSPIIVNLDSEGEQPALSSTVQSYPLIVDTSYASFPSDQPSALLNSENDAEEDEPENESVEGYENEEEDLTDYKSVMKVMGVSLLSVVTVLLVLSWATFLWIKLRECCSRRYFHDYEPHQDLLESQEYCDSTYTPIAVISKTISFPSGNIPITFHADFTNNCKSNAVILPSDCSQHV